MDRLSHRSGPAPSEASRRTRRHTSRPARPEGRTPRAQVYATLPGPGAHIRAVPDSRRSSSRSSFRLRPSSCGRWACTPGFLDRVSIENPDVHNLEIEVGGADRDRWLGNSGPLRGGLRTFEVGDVPGQRLGVPLPYAGVDGGEVVMSRDDLRDNRWRVPGPRGGWRPTHSGRSGTPRANADSIPASLLGAGWGPDGGEPRKGETARTSWLVKAPFCAFCSSPQPPLQNPAYRPAHHHLWL